MLMVRFGRITNGCRMLRIRRLILRHGRRVLSNPNVLSIVPLAFFRLSWFLFFVRSVVLFPNFLGAVIQVFATVTPNVQLTILIPAYY